MQENFVQITPISAKHYTSCEEEHLLCCNTVKMFHAQTKVHMISNAPRGHMHSQTQAHTHAFWYTVHIWYITIWKLALGFTYIVSWIPVLLISFLLLLFLWLKKNYVKFCSFFFLNITTTIEEMSQLMLPFKWWSHSHHFYGFKCAQTTVLQTLCYLDIICTLELHQRSDISVPGKYQSNKN